MKFSKCGNAQHHLVIILIPPPPAALFNPILFKLYLPTVKVSKHKYNDLLKEIRQLVEQARHNVIRNINTELLLTYWNVGRLIVEKEIQDNMDEKSARQLILELSKELTKQVGKEFSRSNLFSMRRFYQIYESVQTVSGQSSRKSVQTLSERVSKTKSLTLSGKFKTGLTVSNQLSWSH